jgi:hypothetical protein
MTTNRYHSTDRCRDRVVCAPVVVAVTALLLGCDGEPPYRNDNCVVNVTAHATVGVDNRELGFSAADAVAFFAGGTGNMVWHDDTTTTVAVSGELAGDSVEVDRFPAGKGYCHPMMTLPANLQLATGDGRLAESWSTSLVAVSDGAEILAVFPGSDPPFSAGFQAIIPAAWRTAGNQEAVELDIQAKRNRLRVYCGASERVSMDPADLCNDRDGVLRFFTRPSDAVEAPSSVFVIGTWRWSE